MGADGESLELGLDVEFHGRFFGEGDGAFRTDATGGDAAGTVTEHKALCRRQ